MSLSVSVMSVCLSLSLKKNQKNHQDCMFGLFMFYYQNTHTSCGIDVFRLLSQISTTTDIPVTDVCRRPFQTLPFWRGASLLDVLIYFNVIYFLVISVHLRRSGYLSDYTASTLLSDKSKMVDTCQQTMLLLLDAVTAEKNTSLKMSICQRFYD